MTLDEWIAKWMPGRAIEVHYTRNRCILINCTSEGPRTSLRIHRVFRDAPRDVARAVVGLYLQRPTGKAARREFHTRINEYIDAREGEILRDWARTIDLTKFPGPSGRYFDLGDRAKRLNRRYFGDALDVFVTWSRNAPRRSMGTWLETPRGFKNVITINRVLDAPRVPAYVVDEVLHHEMLHEKIPAVKKNGRRYKHTPEFRLLERAFPHYERADEWVKSNWDGLVSRYRRRSKQGA